MKKRKRVLSGLLVLVMLLSLLPLTAFAAEQGEETPDEGAVFDVHTEGTETLKDENSQDDPKDDPKPIDPEQGKDDPKPTDDLEQGKDDPKPADDPEQGKDDPKPTDDPEQGKDDPKPTDEPEQEKEEDKTPEPKERESVTAKLGEEERLVVTVTGKTFPADTEIKWKELEAGEAAAAQTALEKVLGVKVEKTLFVKLTDNKDQAAELSHTGKLTVTVSGTALEGREAPVFAILKDGAAQLRDAKQQEDKSWRFETESLAVLLMADKTDEKLPEEQPEIFFQEEEEPEEEEKKEPAVDPSNQPLVEVGPTETELWAKTPAAVRARAGAAAPVVQTKGAGRFKAPVLKAAPAPSTDPVTVDGMTIEKITVRWLSRSTGAEERAGFGTLELETATTEVADQQFQIDFALSGKDDYEPGTVWLTFPAWIWKDRYGKEPGRLTLSVPEDPETGANFAWHRDGDNIVITNVHRISAASKVMIQGSFRDVYAPDMVDKDVGSGSAYAGTEYPGQSKEFSAEVFIQTPEENIISLTSNSIDATINTKVEAASATKSALNTSRREYYVYHTLEEVSAMDKGNIPQAFLESLGGAEEQAKYSFVRWYVSGSAAGSQPFTMTLTDTYNGQVTLYKDALHSEELKETITVPGKMLGVQGALLDTDEDGTYETTGDVLSADGQSVEAVLYDGYNTLSRSAYVWTAYEKSAFTEEGADYEVYNDQTITVKGWDDQKSSTRTASASSPFRNPITYTIKKQWDDGDGTITPVDKNGNPLLDENGQPKKVKVRPENLEFRVRYSDDLGWHYEYPWLNEGNSWQDSWSDDGHKRTYYTDELQPSQYFQSHILEESKQIVTDENGNTYLTYLIWRYKLDPENTGYNQEDHTWTYTNKLVVEPVTRAIVPFTLPKAAVDVHKSTLNYIYSNPLSKTDRALNELRQQRDVVVGYHVWGNSYIMGVDGVYSTDAGRLVSYGRPAVTAELEDNYGTDVGSEPAKGNVYFLNKELKLSPDEAEVDYVTLSKPVYSRYGQYGASGLYSYTVPEDEWIYYDWSYQNIPNAELANAPTEHLLGQRADGTWVEYAQITATGAVSVVSGTGARLMGSNRVEMPAGVYKVKTVVTVPEVGAGDEALAKRIDRVYMDYSIGVRLTAGAEKIQKLLEAVFEQEDYAMCTLDNYVALNLYKGAKTTPDYSDPLLSTNAMSTAYLHGRNHRVAVSAAKEFRMVENDLTMRWLLLHAKVTMTQQSNVLERAEYDQARADGIIPSTASGTWYDLLPIGVRPDLDSVTLTGGDRITDKYTIENYKESGRILLVVKAELSPNISYTRPEDLPTDPDIFRNSDTYPQEGYKDVHTLSYDAVYSWDESQLYGLDHVRNVAAYEADETALGNINGWRGEPDSPTANYNQLSTEAIGLAEEQGYMTGLDKERDPTTHSAFVYAGADLKDATPDFWADTQLRKYVTKDGLGVWTSGRDGATQVTVHEGDYYSYMYTVLSATDTRTKDMILVDKLESYLPIEADGEPALGGGRSIWKGDFVSVDVSDVKRLGVAPVIYYHTGDPDLTVMHHESGIHPGTYEEHIAAEKTIVREYLQNPANGWTTTCPADPSTVTAIAIDLSKKTDGTDFILDENKDLTCEIRMRAKVYTTSGETTDPFNADETLRTEAKNNDYAYNSISLSCTQLDPAAQETYARIHYNYTRVGIVPFELKVHKVWDDANNTDGVRPNGITVTLVANGVPTDKTIPLDDSNDWSGGFDHVLQYDDDGNWINYTFQEASTDSKRPLSEREDPADENSPLIEIYTQNTSRKDQEVTLTNRHEPEKTSLPFLKEWNPGDAGVEEQEHRPESIKVRLLADGVFTGKTLTVTPDRYGEWHGEFTGLPKYTNESGISGNEHEIVYTVEEGPIYLYEDSYSEPDAETGAITITNQYYPYGNLQVSKTVEQSNNKDQEFTFTLLLQDADGNEMTEKFTAMKSGGEDFWVGTIGNGDSFTLKAGEKLSVMQIPAGSSYRVVEDPVTGYTLVSSSDTSGTITASAVKFSEAKFTNQYDARGSQVVELRKTLTGRAMSRNQFDFALLDEDGNQIRTTSSAADGTAKFTAVSYTQADHGKTFTYTIRELAKDKPGYTYDTDTYYTVKVYVEDNFDGTMTCTPTYYRADGTKIDDLTDLETGVVFHNEYHASGSLTLRAWKQLQGGEVKTYAPFHFQLIRADADPASPTYGQGTVVYDDVRCDENGAVLFQDPEDAAEKPLTFHETDVGHTYLYVIREKLGDDNHVIYDKSLKGVAVTVSDNGNGTLALSQQNVTVVEGDPMLYYRGEDTTELPVFTNKLNPGELTVTKHTAWTDGEEPDGELEFPFTLTLIADEGMTLPTTLKAQLSDDLTANPGTYSDENVPTPLTDEEKAQEIDLSFTDGVCTFTLKAGQTLTVKEIPAGLAYQLVEETPSGWTLETVNAAGQIRPKAVDGEETAATFTNTYEPGVATANLIATKRLDGQTPEAGRYAFELVDKTEGSDTEGQVIWQGANLAGGFIQIPRVYRQTGTFRYILREVQDKLVASVDAAGNITWDEDETALRQTEFDTKEYPIAVTVEGDEQQKTATLTYYDTDGTTELETPPQFENKTRPGSLQIRKAADGLTEQNQKAEFTFKVTLSNDAGMPLTDSGAMFWYAQKTEEKDKSPVAETQKQPEPPANAEPAPEETPAAAPAGGRMLRGALRAPLAAPSSTVKDYAYTGSIQTFEVQADGWYRLETWGGEGGGYLDVWEDGWGYTGSWPGGAGGYSYADVHLSAGDTLYIAVGGMGVGLAHAHYYKPGTYSLVRENWSKYANEGKAGGWNGGGKGGDSTSYRYASQSGGAKVGANGGGGATSIVLNSLRGDGQLKNYSAHQDEVLLVAGGGGGAGFATRGRAGGGTTGQGYTFYSITVSGGGQTAGTGYQFGLGQNGIYGTSPSGSAEGSGGGGGGWYGGQAAQDTNKARDSRSQGGAGGSGYVKSGLTGGTTIGTRSIIEPNGSSSTGHIGNGYARITPLDYTIAFDRNQPEGYLVTGDMEPMTVPYDSEVPNLPPCGFMSGDLIFVGWSLDPNAAVADYEDGAKFTDGQGGQAYTLYAVWKTPTSFLLHYNENGGSLTGPSYQRVDGPNASVDLPVADHPSMEFLYWTTDAEGTGTQFGARAMGSDFNAVPDQVVELYAQYAAPGSKGKITTEHYLQKVDGSYEATPANIDYAAYDPDTEVTPNPRNYEARGFKPSPNSEKSTAVPVTAVQGTTTVVKYYYDRTHYTIQFVGGEGSQGSMESITMTGGVPVKLPVNQFTKEGSLFVGWTDGNGVNYGDGQTVHSIGKDGETVTLTAQWFTPGADNVLTPTNGEYIVHCMANETIVFPSLPAGTHYTVEEINLPEGWSLKDIQNGSGTVLSAERVNVKATNQYSAIGYADLVAHKALPGESFESGRFTFELLDESDAVLQTVANSAVDENEHNYTEEGDTVPNPDYGTAPVRFESLSFTAPGVYTYTIREVKNSADTAIRFDEHAEQVKVYVTDRGNGRLNTQVLYDMSGANFVNRMSSGSLTVSKTVLNATAQAGNASFTFTLYFFDSTGARNFESYPVQLPDGTETTVAYGQSVSIKGGESFTVTGLPHQSSYTVVEESTPGFELASKVGSEGTIQAGQTSQAAFTNAYNSSTGDTGAVIEAVKVFKGGAIQAEQFQFRLLDAAGEELQRVYAQPDGTVTFAPLRYTLEQDDGQRYIYYIEEVSGETPAAPAGDGETDTGDETGAGEGAGTTDDPNIIYDTHREQVAVAVSDNGDGTMTAQVEYSGDTPEARQQPPTFTNEMKKGSLRITKSLIRYESSEAATFVFQVEGVDANGATVYSNVTTLDFTGPGTKSVVVEGIPIGAQVTVTEVYSGARYKLTSEESQQTVILSPEVEGAPASVSFTNNYNDSGKGGHGILNTFDAVEDGEGYAWDEWQKPPMNNQ